MYPINNSPFAGLVKVVLALVIIGFFVGLALSGSDLTNFITNSAKAQAFTHKEEIQAQKDAIDLENYQSVQKAVTQSKLEQILADNEAYRESLQLRLQHQDQKNAQELETARLTRYIWMGVGAFVAICLGIGIAIFIIQVGYSRLSAVQSQTKQASDWQDQFWRKQQIKIARQRERAMRETIVSSTIKQSVPPFYPDEDLIPWEELQKLYAK